MLNISGSEDQNALSDHNYFKRPVKYDVSNALNGDKCSEIRKKINRKRGPYSMETEQSDFEQLRKIKLEKINLNTERCKDCKALFTSVTLADKHVRRSTCHVTKFKSTGPQKNVFCEICNEDFATRREYSLHYEQHNPNDTFVCPEPDCGIGFKRKRDWQRHKREQHGSNQMSCTECDYLTARKFSYKLNS